MKKFLLFLLIVVVGFLAYVATRPDTFRVERTATIGASADLIYPRIADFHAWQSWSPWEKLDPAMARDFAGDAGAVGSSYGWTGNKEVGKGKMTISAAQPPSQLTIQLDFIEPFASSNVTTFTLAPEGDGTKVSWVMDGNHNFMSKAMCVFMDMDKMVGADFEKGLASLKSESETAADAAAAAAAAAPAEGIAGEAPAAPASPPAQ